MNVNSLLSKWYFQWPEVLHYIYNISGRTSLCKCLFLRVSKYPPNVILLLPCMQKKYVNTKVVVANGE